MYTKKIESITIIDLGYSKCIRLMYTDGSYSIIPYVAENTDGSYSTIPAVEEIYRKRT